MNILMLYNYVPGTTAWYLERAFREFHDVRTCGPSSAGITYHDIQLEASLIRVDRVYHQLNKHWKIDFFIMIDSGHSFYPLGINSLGIPTIFYAIDTHISFRAHKIIASLFDIVFVAQKEYVEALRQSGKNNIFWLPLACDQEIHRYRELPKIYDICFLGSLNQERKNLLRRISNKFKVYQGYRPFDEVAKFYSQSKIIFNKSVNNDLNMRVFEAMCSGSLLLTDRLKDNGLEDLFQDRKHLVFYDEDNIEDLIQYYLVRDTEREAIAAEGRNYVVNNHTYRHRAKQMLDIIKDFMSKKTYLPKTKINELLYLLLIWFLQTRFGKYGRYWIHMPKKN